MSQLGNLPESILSCHVCGCSSKRLAHYNGRVTFTTRLQLHGKTATGFEVPADVVKSLDAGQRPKINCTINGYTYRTTIAAYSGVYMIPLAAANREAAKVSAGDEISVTVELDLLVREVEIPEDLSQALDRHPGAREKFEKLSYTHKKEHVEAIIKAKAPETRLRRLEKTIAMLVA